MKVKIKGLVFVGFAAAILSANAMAEGENVVTSKSFTEATYQKKIGGTANQLAVTTETAGNVTYKNIETSGTGVTSGAATIPTSGAVADAISTNTTNLNLSQYEKTANKVDTIDTSLDTAVKQTKYPSQAAIESYVTTAGGSFQPKTGQDANYQIGMANGAWYTMAPGDHVTITPDTSRNVVDINIKTTNLASGIQDATSTSVNVPTDYAVQQYVGDQINGALNSGIDGSNYVTATYDTDEHTTTVALDASKITDNTAYTTNSGLTANSDNLITEGAVKAALTDTANVGNGVFTVNINGTSQTFSANQATNTSIEVTGLEVTSNKAQAIDATNSADSTAYPSTAAVYDYVQSQTGGTVIPAKGAICATHPCALVDDASGTHWRTMAAANYNGGECGDATGNCAAANPVDTGNLGD